MNIALLSYGLPVVGQKRGGIERVAHDLAEGLARRGHRVTVWTYDPKPEGASYEVAPLPFRDFVLSRWGRRVTMGYLGNAFALLPRYRDADVLITSGDSLLMPLLGKPLVRIMHGSALGEALTATSALRIVAQSGVYVQELLSAVTQRGTVGVSENTRKYNPFVRRIIPNGVDLSGFRADPSAKTKQPSLLFVGTLEGRKRGRLLLDWFTQYIRPALPDATLEMVSPPGPELPGVTYHTGISGEQLATLYRAAWVLAAPSTYEGFGLPYIEAMASGTPVVATPNVGSREVLGDGHFGRLVEDADFPGALLELLTDEAARAELVRLGLERAQHYSLERTLDQYEALLHALTGK